MPSRVKLLAHALAEIQEQYEALEVRFEKAARENAKLRVRVRDLEAKLAVLEAPRGDVPRGRGE